MSISGFPKLFFHTAPLREFEKANNPLRFFTFLLFKFQNYLHILLSPFFFFAHHLQLKNKLYEFFAKIF